MHTMKKVLMGVAALAALALGGATIASATGGGEGATGQRDETVTGSAAQNAGRAAQTAVGGGRVVSVERSDEGGSAYEAKIDRAGKVIEVQLDEGYGVVSRKADDDRSEQHDPGDGDGETNDDSGAAGQVRGDGDGETQDG
jgi:hypothetical protein